MPAWKIGASRPPSAQPWSIDPRDPQMILDRDSQVVGVTTSRSDAERIVRCVNAVAALPPEALEASVLEEAIHVLRELCRFHADPEYRRKLETAGSVAMLQARVGQTIRILGAEDRSDERAPAR